MVARPKPVCKGHSSAEWHLPFPSSGFSLFPNSAMEVDDCLVSVEVAAIRVTKTFNQGPCWTTTLDIRKT